MNLLEKWMKFKNLSLKIINEDFKIVVTRTSSQILCVDNRVTVRVDMSMITELLLFRSIIKTVIIFTRNRF